MNETARRARRLFQANHQGVLSTVSTEVAGYPYGSVVSFACASSGWPVLFVSTIAEHTRNLEAEPRVSLIVTEAGEDAQELGRLTLLGRAIRAGDGAGIADRYFRRFPHAQEYRRMHDFSFWQIEPVRIRYIGGFGRIHWLEPADVCRLNPFAPAVEAGMVAHMNDAHADALAGYCRNAGIEPGAPPARLAGIDGEGFDLMLGKRLLRIGFTAPVQTPDAVRREMVALARRSQPLESAA